MKNTKKLVVGMMLCLMMVIFAGCGKKDADDLWSDAVYTEDAEVGEGEKTVQVDFTLGEKKITFTIHTDQDILGEILLGNELITG